MGVDANDLTKVYGPLQPSTIKVFYKSKKGSKDMYNILKIKYNKKNINRKCEAKWSQLRNCEYNWKHTHSFTFKVTKNSKLQWFQYRIIHRILGTNNFLSKINLSTPDKCSFCSNETDTVDHLFWSCQKTARLWEQLNQWIFENTEIELPLNLNNVLFGIVNLTDKNLVRNLVILLSKFYIYRTKLREEQVSFAALR